MNFPEALQACLNGKRITNLNWNGKNMYVFKMGGSRVPNSGYVLGLYSGVRYDKQVTLLPYLVMCNAKGEFVPWLISNMDVFSDGWEVLE